MGVAKWLFPQPPLPPFATTAGASSETSASSVLYKGASRHAYYKVGAVFAEAALSAAGQTVFRRVFSFITEVGEGGKIVVGQENDVAALPSVAPVGTAGRNVFFPSEGYGSVASVTGFYFDFRNINKHLKLPFGQNKRAKPQSPP